MTTQLDDTTDETELQGEKLKEVKKNYYVDKHTLYSALVTWKAQRDLADAEGREHPPMSNFIAECLMKIARHLSFHPWFIRYSYRDDMVMDGVEACIRYAKSFDPSKSKEAFSYFTRTCWRAFRHRCDKEYSESLLKGELIAELSLDTAFAESDVSDDGELRQDMRQFVIEHSSYGTRPEKKKRVRPKKDYSSPLDDFYVQEEPEESVDTIQ